MCPRFSGGSRQGLRPAPAGQFAGLIRGLFITGTRVTFKLELQLTRGQRGEKNGWHQGGVPPGPVGDGQKRPKTTARELPGKTLLVNYDQVLQRFNPLTDKLFNLNFHPLEIVSR